MPSHTLVTFLQAVPVNSKNPDVPLTFQTATYDFGDSEPVAQRLCGLALLKELSRGSQPPRRFVIVGTPGSAWARLMAHVDPEISETELANLEQAVRANAVAELNLIPWKSRLENALRRDLGLPDLDVHCVVTGYAKDDDGQRNFIELLSPHVPQGGSLTLDATHGLRHISLLAVFSAMALRRLKDAKLLGVYYGAFELREKDLTPVLRLDGLPRIADWLAALSAFDKDGDYGVFEKLLEDAGVPAKVAANLADASFAEMIGNYSEARLLLVNFRSVFRETKLSGAAALFRHEILTRTNWGEDKDHYDRQRRLAFEALDRGDAIRACTRGYEAFITRLTINANKDPSNEKERNTQSNAYFDSNVSSPSKARAKGLRFMRHRIAHVDFAERDHEPFFEDVLRLMGRRASCLKALTEYLTDLLPERAG